MSVRPVLSIPHSTLSTPSLPIEVIGELERQLARDLVDTMRASPACVGLAAPQIGAGLKAFAMDVSSHKKARTNHGLVVLFNPEIVWQEDPITAREGC
ncbi:MAG TPA: peptide deformylase, partial [Acidimicrobiales bacterium]|nr:peptide deformylase [Acidimicrobiales bacterium]